MVLTHPFRRLLLPALAAFTLAGAAAPASETSSLPPTREDAPVAAVPVNAPEWPFTGDGLTPDPAVIWGRLENGVRFAVRPQTATPGRVSLRLLVLAGSLHERADERGYAHFVEHMAFNGTRRWPHETLAAELQRHGIAFGPDLTAFTLATHTIYHVDLPAAGEERLTLGFDVLREFADGLTFVAKDVERERGVVLAELASQSAALRRAAEARAAFVHGDNLLGRRMRSDEAASVSRARAWALRAFHERWYQPGRIIVIAVGDVAPDVLEAQVRRSFGSLRSRRAPVPLPDLGPVTTPAGVSTHFTFEPEIGALAMEAIVARREAGADSRAVRDRWLARSLAVAVLNRRLRARALAEPATFGQLQAEWRQPAPEVVELVVAGQSRHADHEKLLHAVDQELRRALLHGFLPEELAGARAGMLADFALGVRHHPTSDAAVIAAELVSSIVLGQVHSSPARLEEIAQETLPRIGPAECGAALREFVGEAVPRLFAYGYDGGAFEEAPVGTAARPALTTSFTAENLSGLPVAKPEVGNDTLSTWIQQQQVTLASAQMGADWFNANKLTRLYAAARGIPVKPPRAPKPVEFSYALRPAGAIRQRRHVDDVDVELVEFANGVRLNLKRTGFDAGTVMLTAGLRMGGVLAEPPQRPGLHAFASRAFLAGGLGRHDLLALQQAFAGHVAQLTFAVEEDAAWFRGMADAREASLLLRLLAAYLADPGWREDAFETARSELMSEAGFAKIDPAAALGAELAAWLATGDARYHAPDTEAVAKRRPAELRRWLGPSLRHAPLEVGIVGDFDPEEIIQLAARTVGALPRRRDEAAQGKPPRFEREGRRRTVPVFASDGRSAVSCSWHVAGGGDGRFSRVLELLCALLEERVVARLREDLQLVYTPGCSCWFSEAAPADGYLQAHVIVAAAHIDQTIDVFEEIAAELAAGRFTDEELERVRQPALAGIERQLHTNGWWLHHVVAQAQSDPARFEWPRTRRTDLAAITREEIARLARDLLASGRMQVLVAAPEQGAAGE